MQPLLESRSRLRSTGFVLGSTPASGVGGGASPPPELVTSYTYSPSDGRLSKVTGGSSSFTYNYLPNSNLLHTITAPAHSVTNTYEPTRDVLISKQNNAGANLISGHSYTVNNIGQRTATSQSGSAFAAARSIDWGYDALGQVTKADSTIPGLSRAYSFDMIGNRISQSGGDLGSPISYTSNSLNQYTAVGAITPTYDLDGNATAYPLPANLSANSTLVWDGENRLISATVSGVTTNYRYDSGSRRIAKISNGNFILTVYDGWNPIAEYSSPNLQSPISHVRSFTWGMDLSGTMQGAGGVGGLLLITDHSALATSYFPTFDGNGNVSEYLNSTGAMVAHYEYDPFGKTTVATGAKAADFTHRFSTKPLDSETGLYYYGYRFYDPATGRWPSRDPIGEAGSVPWFLAQDTLFAVKIVLWQKLKAASGLDKLVYVYALNQVDAFKKKVGEQIAGPNQYSVVLNQPINQIDILGLAGFWEKWDAVWDAGLIDARNAKNIADKAAKDARATGLPGPHNGPQDAYRHCLASCKAARDIGEEDTKQITDNHEDHGGGPADENSMDRHNNSEGMKCAKEKKSCEKGCLDKLSSGVLVTLPPSRW